MKKYLIRFLTVLLCLSAIFSAGLTAFAKEGTDDGAVTFSLFDLGDANGNGEVNIVDLIRIKHYTTNTSVAIDPAADINVDGNIDSNDMVLLKKILLGISF